MDILFVTAELAPVMKGTSLGDAVFALSKTLKNLGHRVTIAMPRYPVLEQAGILAARRLTPTILPAGGGEPRTEVTVFDGRLASGVDLVLFDTKGPAGSDSLFADVTKPTGSPFFDSEGRLYPLASRRVALLCRAAVELMKQRVAADNGFDVVHCRDWTTALIPYLMRLHPELDSTRSVFTIHDISRQGMFEREDARAALAAFALGEDHFTPQRLEFYGGLNMLKGGLISADAVTTISPNYAREIATEKAGERLDGVLRARKAPVIGVLDAIDYSVWNPATDPALAARYDADDPSNKARCKAALLAELGLEMTPSRPLFVFVGKLDPRRGGDVLAEALPRILKQDISVLISGEGDPAIALAIDQAVKRAPERAKHVGVIADDAFHRWVAAADFVLSPARREPCGSMQARAQRYGAVPVATNTGGFLDTIVDVDVALETGTGILHEVDALGLVSGVGRAVTAYAHPRFAALRRRLMRLDVGWDRPARRYAQLYKQLVQVEAPVTAAAPLLV